MSRTAVFLRLLLSVALVLNGIGSAAATGRMATMHAPAATAAAGHATALAALAAPCDAHAGARHAQPSSHAHEVGTHTPPHRAPGCCDPATCSCDCMQPAQAVRAFAFFLGRAVEPSVVVRTMTSAHAAPALPHLIRPPIA